MDLSPTVPEHWRALRPGKRMDCPAILGTEDVQSAIGGRPDDPNDYGYCCTRRKGHQGPHVAHVQDPGGKWRAIRAWSRRDGP